MHCFYRLLVIAGLAVGMVQSASAAAPVAEDLSGVTRLYEQRQMDRALQEVDAFLKNQPKDARARFLKGLILSEMGRTNDAVAIFVELGSDYPNIAEPFNNLAVLYAQQGKYDDARAALEAAVRRNPAYGTAQENLGDVYTRLAIRAYEAALQAAPGSIDLKQKVQGLKDFSIRMDSTANRSANPVTAKAEPRVEPKPAPSRPAAAPEPSVAAQASKPAAPPQPAPAAPAPAKPAAGDTEKEVLALVKKWSESWASNDVPGYLAVYAPEFKLPAGLTRAAWEAQRKQRIAKPRQIQVNISNPKVSPGGDGAATVVFTQHYKSGTIDTTDTKTLALRKSNGEWRIVEESTGN